MTMHYRRLGRTGLKVSEVCLGCMTFGDEADEETSRQLVDQAIDSGVNFFDTANVYNEGASEEILGRALRGRRTEFVVATKFRGMVGEGPNDVGASRQHILREVEQSLSRLQTDYIDLYQIHRYDAATPIEETLRALDDLVHQGKVRYIGCSNFSAWQLTHALWVSDLRNLARFDSIQPLYNVLARNIERELMPACQEFGVGIISYHPLAAGFLTGKYRKGMEPPIDSRFAVRPVSRSRYWHDRTFDAAEDYLHIAAESGLSPAALAVAWVLSRRGISSAILGARNARQLTDSLGGVGSAISPEIMTRLGALWPMISGGDAATPENLTGAIPRRLRI